MAENIGLPILSAIPTIVIHRQTPGTARKKYRRCQNILKYIDKNESILTK